MEALSAELAAAQSKLSSEIESNKKVLEDAHTNAKKTADEDLAKSEMHAAELNKEISNLKAQLDLSNTEKMETTEKI